MTCSITDISLFTGTNTDFNHYLNNENAQGLVDKPKVQSAFATHICLL